ncbi:MAG: hypothetical protein ACYDAG_01550 [Chloroflexota bacterium]
MRIKGMERERKYRKRRYGMRVDGAGVRRVQLALLERGSNGPPPFARARRSAGCAGQAVKSSGAQLWCRRRAARDNAPVGV